VERKDQSGIGRILAFFARYCGWTIGEIFSHTIEELKIIMESLAELIQMEKEFEATIHGAKISLSRSFQDIEKTLEEAKAHGWPIEIR
jgi:adenosine deaminase